MGSSVDKRKHLLKSCLKELHSCIDYVNQYSENQDQHFSVLKDITKQYCEIDDQYNRAQQACEATDSYFDNQENDCTKDVQEIYNKYLEDQPISSNFNNHPIWRNINKAIQGEKPDAQPESGGASEESDVELQDDNQSMDEGIIPSQFEPPVDPITKKVIENPCKNRKCGHVYEYSTVMDHLKKIKQNKTKPRCPYIGCTNGDMRPSFIIKDNELKNQINNYLADAANRTTENDASTSRIIL